MQKYALVLFVVLFSASFAVSQEISFTQGTLDGVGKDGKRLGVFALKHTNVKVEISGFIARVKVMQEFENNFFEPIEAIYVFPLSQNSAVDDMTMKIGERMIRGQIMKREDAKKVYEAAKSQGKTASLLDQERPNVFTQSVANIKPGEKILIEISYVETLKFEDGEYEFVFPMVVSPRYDPSSKAEKYLDRSKIGSNKRLSESIPTRSGQDISIEIKLDAGVPIEAISSALHEIEVVNLSSKSANIRLKDQNTIPNKDFILRYDVTGKQIQDAILTHKDERGGFFTLILSPPQDFGSRDVTPKEIVFVLDTSGSMSGFPIEKAKEAMRLTLEGLNPNDTFNLITFAGETSVLFEKPVAATPENLRLAQQFLASKQSSGGTEMMNAIRAAFAPGESTGHLRVVCFMTDGLVNNEAEIIAEVQSNPQARVFAFGIGNSVNRYLLDKISSEGRGETEYVSLKDDGDKAARRFYERIRSPLLTDISIDWKGLPVSEIYPRQVPDLFSAKPLIITGRYKDAASGSINLTGKVGGQVYAREIAVNLPEQQSENEALASLWARKKVDVLSMEKLKAKGDESQKITNAIIDLGLTYRLLTEFTSFVAVEDTLVMKNGIETRVSVPVSSLPPVNNNPRTQGLSSVPIVGDLFRRNTGGRNPRNAQGQTKNDAANVVGLELSTTVNGRTVILGDSNSNRPEPNLLPESAPEGVLKAILNRVETHRSSLTSLRADITTTKYAAAANESDISTGTMIFLPGKPQGGLFRFDLTKPQKQVLAIVNENLVLYQPQLNQAITGKVENEKSNPLFFLNLSKEFVKQNFTVKYLGEEKLSSGISAWHLELTPKQAKGYKTIELWIDGNGMPVRSKTTSDNGDHFDVQLTNLRKNQAIDPSEFRLALPKDTKIIKN